MRGSGRTAAALAAIALISVLAAAGCGRNSGPLPTDAFPRGQRNEAEAALVATVLAESVGTELVSFVDLTIYDLTPATSFRLYRRVEEGGYELVSMATAEHVGTFNQGGELFHFVDRTAPLGQRLEYVARGVVNGEETVNSPLTNSAFVPSTTVLSTLYPTGFALLDPIEDAVTDTTPVLTWEAVPGADRYLVQLIRTDGELFFVGLTEPGATSYTIGSHTGTLVQERPLTPSIFFWFVQAIDPWSRIIGGSFPGSFRADTTTTLP